MTEQSDLKAFFSTGVKANMDALYGVALRLTKRPADAEDLVAEAVTRAWSAIDSLADRKSFRSWLFRILNNCYISDYRKKSIRPTESSFEEPFGEDEPADVCSFLMEQPDEFLAWWANPEQTYFRNLLGEQIMAAIAGLPEAFRVTVLLVNVEGLTYDEAAEALGVPEGTIRSRMKRGRTLLQKALWLQARDAGFGDATNPNECEV